MPQDTAAPGWAEIASRKRREVASKIPQDWLLPASLRPAPAANEWLAPGESGESGPATGALPAVGVLDVPARSGILTPRERELTERYDAVGLLDLMATRQATSEDVVRAFCKRAAVAHQLVNCCTEMLFDEAMQRAKACDDFLSAHGRPLGPLHGLPLSFKDSFNIQGVHSTIGYVLFVDDAPAEANSTLVELLVRAGAVPFVKTNLPQTMMTADADNNVFGRTLNPNKLTLTAGGSTGGEGALVKMRGSVLGVATDVAGSNRIPPLCNGVMSFKPTEARVPFGGKTPPGRLGSPGSIVPTIGPLGHSVRDLELFFRTVMDSDPWQLDEGVVAVPWRRVSSPDGPLKFGFLTEDAKRPLHPTVRRAMLSAKAVLEKAGHYLVSLDGKVPSIWDAAVLSQKFFLLDPQKTPVKHINASGEPWVPSIKTFSFPELAGWQPSLDELWDMNVERKRYLKAFHDVFVDNKLDAILMPGYQATAVPHDTYGVAIYTVLLNLLDYPAAMLPYMHASKELDRPYIRNVKYEPPYRPDEVEGAPGAVQLVGRPMKDEELLQIMGQVEKLLREAETDES